jgi:hypothetical protein
MRRRFVGLVTLVLAAGVACSSSSGSSSSSSASSCDQQIVASTACYTCGQNSCGSQLSSYESACSSYFSCVCPGGTYSVSAFMSSTCSGDLTGSCGSADNALLTCISQNCVGACG